MTTQPLILYMARHGQTEYNRQRRMQGRSVDASLNETGLRQGAALAARMEGEALDAVYCSTLARARETAELLAEPHGIKPVLLPDLAEMAWGTLEGTPIDDHLEYLQNLGSRWRAGQFGDRVGGAESILDVERRARSVFSYLGATHADGERIFVVTHGRFMRVLLSIIVPGASLKDMDEFPHSNTGVYRAERLGGVWSVTVRNDTKHLEEVAP
ncbi:MAG: histidine phosphatase family protein [Rhodothermales bacterium]|nr:histidine phosphatase family protein [Rhodothermales bacterium]